MRVDLSKCKVGDKAVRKDGMVVELTEISTDKWRHKKFDGWWYSDDGVLCGCDSKQKETIVSIVTPKPVKKNVAKIIILDGTCGFPIFRCKNLGIKSFNYASKKSAIRGARRFCARIGFECEIVEDAK